MRGENWGRHPFQGLHRAGGTHLLHQAIAKARKRHCMSTTKLLGPSLLRRAAWLLRELSDARSMLQRLPMAGLHTRQCAHPMLLAWTAIHASRPCRDASTTTTTFPTPKLHICLQHGHAPLHASASLALLPVLSDKRTTLPQLDWLLSDSVRSVASVLRVHVEGVQCGTLGKAAMQNRAGWHALGISVQGSPTPRAAGRVLYAGKVHMQRQTHMREQH